MIGAAAAARAVMTARTSASGVAFDVGRTVALEIIPCHRTRARGTHAQGIAVVFPSTIGATVRQPRARIDAGRFIATDLASLAPARAAVRRARVRIVDAAADLAAFAIVDNGGHVSAIPSASGSKRSAGSRYRARVPSCERSVRMYRLARRKPVRNNADPMSGAGADRRPVRANDRSIPVCRPCSILLWLQRCRAGCGNRHHGARSDRALADD